MPSTTNTVDVGSGGRLRIIIDQQSQNQGNNTSQVRVRGILLADYHSWHSDSTISRSISGTDDYTPGDFGFDIPDGGSDTYIDHTFTLGHNSDGTKSVSFTVHYGDTGVGTFDGPRSCGDSLTLTRIPKRPDPPGAPAFTNVMPTSLTVSWSGSPDNNGSAITNYKLRRWTGSSMSGAYVDSNANNLVRNVTGLIPGTTYTFAVYAKNSSADNDGYSNVSSSRSTQLLAGVWIRVGGIWKMAVPYIRTGGKWKLATPYVRSGGVWKLTK